MLSFLESKIPACLAAIPNCLATSMELNFDATSTVQYMATNYWIPLTSVSTYFLFITLGPKIMEHRKPFDLTNTLATWNASLCLFSFIGMLKTVPMMFSVSMTQSFEQTVCTHPFDSWGTGPTGFWVMLFCFSKIPELIDTVFIVLRKKNLIFLHWYHHITVLLFCWNAYATMSATGLYFVSMNYSVHALMYGYYCLQALKKVPRSFPTVLITLSQIVQMFIGTGVCASAWYFKLKGHDCRNEDSNLIAGGLMYGSYLYLFCAFACKRYGTAYSTKSAKMKIATTADKIE